LTITLGRITYNPNDAVKSVIEYVEGLHESFYVVG